ncbi:MAG: GGDEF domain-containing protein [Gammaproteobacteria bacterium]|nr:GGDEF domain-containing protein [Gammaproteobacteria bacterium]MBJ54149.1 GGDEF domain-containing protein [Gammaproteobacteria bacterium]HBN14152.1 GGDEF domain-containing protein [Pseudohongiella sp.]|tara:strand:- start:281 stop:1249 length:969 start_codon:yes stop_codon:yes gene_type:complete
MIAPPIPADEKERLSQLRSLSILDTPPEERFDRVTRMARRLFGVPIALVSLVDENRQWFKSCFGLDATETGRDISFCGHAIVTSGTFVIEDATQDERFYDNPLVTGEPFIRFYAGHPLRTMSGQAMGTLCLIDREPRQFDDDDHAMLADLAGMVERELMAVQLAVSDELTRISNRRGFLALSKYSLELCKRQLFPATLVFFDLDKFKQINDTHGHAEGDRVLKIFADQMRESFRTSDLFARLGGDEFVALLTNVSPANITEMMNQFASRLQANCDKLSLPYEIGFSYGLVTYEPLKHSSVEDMLHEADGAMYINKRAKHTEI